MRRWRTIAWSELWWLDQRPERDGGADRGVSGGGAQPPAVMHALCLGRGRWEGRGGLWEDRKPGRTTQQGRRVLLLMRFDAPGRCLKDLAHISEDYHWWLCCQQSRNRETQSGNRGNCLGRQRTVARVHQWPQGWREVIGFWMHFKGRVQRIHWLHHSSFVFVEGVREATDKWGLTSRSSWTPFTLLKWKLCVLLLRFKLALKN